MKTTIRDLYRSLLPRSVRSPIAQLRSRLYGTLWPPSHARDAIRHEINWMMASTSERRALVKNQLRCKDYPWVFLVGTNNSGTTLFQRVVQKHPGVRSMVCEYPNRSFSIEGQHATRELPVAQDYGIERRWGTEVDKFRLTENDQHVDALRVKYDWSRYFTNNSGPLFEKSPLNTVRSRWLQAHFDPSKFIVTVRSPYAVCEGIRRRNGYSVQTCAKHWRTANEVLLNDVGCLDAVMTYTYEGFCENPGDVLSRVQSFLGLEDPFDLASLRRVESHSIEGRTRGIQNMNPRSIERLSDDDIQTINRVAGSVMERLGYERL